MEKGFPELYLKCGCGYEAKIDPYDYRVISLNPGYVSESGTDWAGEVELTCANCGGRNQLR